MDPLKNQTPPQEARLHFLDYWRIIRIRKTVIVTVALLVALTATVVTFLLTPTYSSTAEIKIEPDTVSDIPTLNGGQTIAPFDPYFIQTEFQVIQDQVVLGKVINDLNLNVEWGKKYNGGQTLETIDTMELLKKRMDLEPVRNTKLIDITVYSEDKDEAARIANAIAQAYRDYRLSQRKEMALGGIKAMQESLEAEDEKIQTLQTNVDNLRQKLKINDTDPSSTSPSPTLSSDQLQHYTQLLIEGQASYIKAKEQLDGLTASTNNLRDVLPTIISDPGLSDLLTKYNSAEQDFVRLTNDYTMANPEVARVQSVITKLNEQINDRVNGIMRGMADNVKSQKAALDSLALQVNQAKSNDLYDAAMGQPYWEAKQRLQNEKDFRKLLAFKIESEKNDISIPSTSIVEITQPAQPGKDPVRPKKALNIILGVVVGLIVGVGLAFFIEYLDTSVKTIDEVERAFQAPVLGVIPQNVGHLIDEGPESSHAEAYRVLRTNILFSRKDDEKLNSIVVVSAGAGEGKSTTTLNLSTVFAQSGQRVLVIDSDLRRPTLHKILRVGNNIGLTDYLLKQKTLEEVIQRTSLPTLDFMASGKLPSSSMGILSSVQMRDMISALKQRYDYIFFDSPPIMGVSDASILASEVDLVVQVIQYRRYPQPMNIRAKQLIEKVGGNLVGIVLNNINMSQDESYYYYSGYYHSYYYYSHNENEQEAAAKAAGGDDAGSGIKQKY